MCVCVWGGGGGGVTGEGGEGGGEVPLVRPSGRSFPCSAEVQAACVYKAFRWLSRQHYIYCILYTMAQSITHIYNVLYIL